LCFLTAPRSRDEFLRAPGEPPLTGRYFLALKHSDDVLGCLAAFQPPPELTVGHLTRHSCEFPANIMQYPAGASDRAMPASRLEYLSTPHAIFLREEAMDLAAVNGSPRS
jgi:hypothetical protein